MNVEIQITGDKDVMRAIQRIKKNAPGALDGALLNFATEIQREAVQSIQQHRSKGETYRRGNVQHTASTPGNPPNTDTGQLVRNITVSKINGGYDVGSRKGAPHGFWLEHGVREFGTFRIHPRPWLMPAFQKAKAAFRKFANEVRAKL